MFRKQITLVMLVFTALNTNSQNKPSSNSFEGSIEKPITGPAPLYNYGADTKNYQLICNYDFGKNGNIKTYDDLDKYFQYHDQFNTFANGINYGAYTVAHSKATALDQQPVEGIDTKKPIRAFFDSSMRTYLSAVNGNDSVNPLTNKAGCGSFQTKFTLPNGGSLLGHDLIWETRVRYVTPPYFWFAIWTCGKHWDKGAEIDVIESFGWEKANGTNNFDGHYWHSSPVGATMEWNYFKDWPAIMKLHGIENYDATQYHTWTFIYKKDNRYENYLDGILVQKGICYWTLSGKEGGTPIDMNFIFDAGWGHKDVKDVNKTMHVKEFEGKFYEWDFSRIYLR